MKFLKFILIIIILFPLSCVNAEENDKRNKITKNLRCLICQGQSVYDSDSEFANSLKIVVDKKLQEGFSCLLYTSPSPRDATLSRMPSSA